MPEANGNYVKVYLYVFRSFYRSVPDFSTARAAEALHMLESEILEALSYWQRQGVLRLRQDGEQLWISFSSIGPQPPGGTHQLQENLSHEQTKVIRVERKPVYSPEEIDIYSQNPTIARLFREAPSVLRI